MKWRWWNWSSTMVQTDDKETNRMSDTTQRPNAEQVAADQAKVREEADREREEKRERGEWTGPADIPPIQRYQEEPDADLGLPQVAPRFQSDKSTRQEQVKKQVDRAAAPEPKTQPVCPRCGHLIPNDDAPGTHKGPDSKVKGDALEPIEICEACGEDEEARGEDHAIGWDEWWERSAKAPEVYHGKR